MKFLKVGMGVLISGILLAGCAGASVQETSIKINGSTSVAELFETKGDHEGIIDAYAAVVPNVSIKMSPTGSSDGIRAVQTGATEIGMSSRNLKPEERSGINQTTIAIDAVAVVVNSNNSVSDITLAQLKDIYTGKITNWKELGGKDAPISVVAREAGSGTRGAFEELLEMKDAMTTSAQEFNGTGAIRTEVAQNENSIGYISLGAVDESLKILKLDGVEASAENIKNGTYTMQRPFILLYKDNELSNDGKAFIEWVVSPDGQKIVADKKYISIN